MKMNSLIPAAPERGFFFLSPFYLPMSPSFLPATGLLERDWF